jgi:hypothetical protein
MLFELRKKPMLPPWKVPRKCTMRTPTVFARLLNDEAADIIRWNETQLITAVALIWETLGRWWLKAELQGDKMYIAVIRS